MTAPRVDRVDRVDRLILRVGGIAPADGPRLARMIAGALASLDVPGGALSAPALRIQLAAQPGQPLERLSQRIAGQLAIALRSP